MARLIYSTSIYVYSLLIRLAALFYPKAKSFIRGRKNWESKLQSIAGLSDRWLWVHCSSLGEFEQGRPVIEKIRREHPDISILLTFFSPSGFKVRKNYEHADAVMYMPMDTRRNARKFVKILKPRASLFIKYEFWYHHLKALHASGIPVFLISAVFRPSQVFFKWYGVFFRRMLRFYTTIFVQDEQSKTLLKGIHTETKISGDTRFDRVWEITHETCHNNLLEAFSKDNKRILVAGSTWIPDETILEKALHAFPDMKLILAPHETDTSRIEKVAGIFASHQTCVFSRADLKHITNCRVLIIDSMGFLSKLYRYGDFAYIGGGFGKGIHNTLEAACYGIPVIFGPNYQRFNEAKELMQQEAAFSIVSEAELIHRLKMLVDDNFRQTAGENALTYVKNKRGASQKILHALQKSDVF